MSDIFDRVFMVRQAQAVKRYHILRMLRTQTVGEHSGAVATLVMLFDPDCSATLLKAALCHDLHERSTGDMPSTAKTLHPPLAQAMQQAEDKWNKDNGFEFELTPAEQHMLKFCDYLELLLWCIEDRAMGNGYAIEAIRNIKPALTALGAPNDTARRFLAQVLMD